jgi:hypothetical protein
MKVNKEAAKAVQAAIDKPAAEYQKPKAIEHATATRL